MRRPLFAIRDLNLKLAWPLNERGLRGGNHKGLPRGQPQGIAPTNIRFLGPKNFSREPITNKK